MSRFHIGPPVDGFLNVLAFTGRHWSWQPARVATIMISMFACTLADVLTPLYTGRLVDAVADGAATQDVAWQAALAAFSMLIGLALGAIVMRHVAFTCIIELTLKMLCDISSEAFDRVQRFSTDWHANSFAGSTVRQITRGMGALDLLNSTILIALFPSLIMLIGSAVLLGWHWPMMGLITACGSLAYVGLTITLTLEYIAPPASLANSWDSRLGGALADAISCNPVVKGFAAEQRENERLAKVIAKWRRRMRRTWVHGAISGSAQGATLLALRATVICYALVLCSRHQATAGDIALVLTSFFVLQGYLRDIGMHVRNVQRSVNDMEELVYIQSQPLDIADCPEAKQIRIMKGRIDFKNVYFHYGNDGLPLFRDFSVSIKARERVGLVGPSGSGKTTFVKLIQRLYDVKGGRIQIDDQDISKVRRLRCALRLRLCSRNASCSIERWPKT